MIAESVRKRTILLAIFLVLIVIFSAEPVIAVPKPNNQKMERTVFTNRCVVPVRSIYKEGQVTENNIYNVQNVISTGYVEDAKDPSLSGALWTSVSGTVDLNTMVGSFNGKWKFTSPRGIFEGSFVAFITVDKISGRFVGRGTNDIREQKIMGSFEGTLGNYIANVALHGELTSK